MASIPAEAEESLIEALRRENAALQGQVRRLKKRLKAIASVAVGDD